MEQIFFVFGSVLTCALVLWIAQVQAATTPVVVKAVIPIENDSNSEIKPETTQAVAAIQLCPTPSNTDANLQPAQHICDENSGQLLSSIAMDFASILASQHALPLDENTLRTNVPAALAPEEIVAIANTEDSIESSMEHLCALNATSSEASDDAGDRQTFALAANRLLCEAVGASEDARQFDHSTFVAFKN